MSDKAKTGRGAEVAPPDPWDPLVRISHWTIAAAVIINHATDHATPPGEDIDPQPDLCPLRLPGLILERGVLA